MLRQTNEVKKEYLDAFPIITESDMKDKSQQSSIKNWPSFNKAVNLMSPSTILFPNSYLIKNTVGLKNDQTEREHAREHEYSVVDDVNMSAWRYMPNVNIGRKD